MFRIALLTILLPLQYILYAKTQQWLGERHPHSRRAPTATTIVFLTFNLALVIVTIVRPRLLNPPSWFLLGAVYPFYIWYGATFLIGLVVLALSLTKLPFLVGMWLARRISFLHQKIDAWQSREPYQRFDASRRRFLRRGMYGITATSFAGISYGVFSSRTDHELTNVEFPIAGLHPHLQGFTIALLSDIHSSVFMTKHDMDVYVQHVNDLKADLIAVTGDFVNGLTEEVYPFTESFCNLKAPLGVYGVMGNHDFYAQDPETVAKEVNGCGVVLLRNDKVILKKGDARFYLLGIDDVGTPQRAANKMAIAIGSLPLLELPKILLCHRPYFVQQASEKRMDLVLSGHTHGGQIVFGHLGNVSVTPAALASPYVWGRYRVADTQMYVSRGIGTVGIPVRINCPPEITRIILTSA